MDILGGITAIASGLVKPIAGVFTKKIERKQAKDAIDGQVKMAQKNNEAQVNIDTGDWEKISKQQEVNSWKDEYITISVFSIFNAVIIGSIADAFGFTGGASLVDGVMAGIRAIDELDGKVGDLIMVVAYAGLSIKFIKDVVK